MKRSLISSTVFLAMVLMLSGQIAWSQIPQTISYQGVLTDANGIVVSNGNYQLTFRLYDVAAGGTALWTETHSAVTVDNGVFNVILGSLTSFNLPFDKQYYLGVSVGGDPELAPRIQLASSPYSLSSLNTGGANGWSLTGNSGTNPATNFLGTTDMQSFELRVNNLRGLRLDPITGFPSRAVFEGDVNIGSTMLERKLNVVGSIEAVSSSVNGIGVVGNGKSIGVHGRVNDPMGTAGVFDNPFAAGKILSGQNNGAEKFNVDVSGNVFASGNVGIGTTNPQLRLHLSGLGTGAGGASLSLENSGTDGKRWDIYSTDNTFSQGSGKLLFYRAWADGYGGTMVLNSNGNVGIGTTNPSAYKLEVQANFNTAIVGINSGGHGIYGESNQFCCMALWGRNTGGGLAGFFQNDVQVVGNLSKGGGSFKIDHPLDPANKYLSHSFVESPDMMNIYNGNVILDAKGEAVVELPGWFEALNRDFRYQLTAIGAPGPNLYIAEEISDNRFRIAGGARGMKVSWQVTGIRQDAYANAHRIPVEEEKPVQERGYYLHPELHTQPEEKGIEWARHPEIMQQMKARQQLKQK